MQLQPLLWRAEAGVLLESSYDMKRTIWANNEGERKVKESVLIPQTPDQTRMCELLLEQMLVDYEIQSACE